MNLVGLLMGFVDKNKNIEYHQTSFKSDKDSDIKDQTAILIISSDCYYLVSLSFDNNVLFYLKTKQRHSIPLYQLMAIKHHWCYWYDIV